MQAEISKIEQKRLKQARNARKVTLRALGEAVGYKASTISGVESGKTKPSERLVSDIVRELGINEQWLETGEGEIFLNKAEIEARHSKERIRTSARQIKAHIQASVPTITWRDPISGEEKVLTFAKASAQEWSMLCAQLQAAYENIANR